MKRDDEKDTDSASQPDKEWQWLDDAILHFELDSFREHGRSELKVAIQSHIQQLQQGARLEEVTRMSNDDVWPTTLSLSEYQKFRIKELKQLAVEREGNEG